MSLSEPTHRVTTTLTESDFKQLEFWAKKHGISINDYIKDAIALMIRWENKDYDLPTLEIQRLNQLVDAMAVMSANVHSLEQVITSGFDSLLGLTRGDNYLLEHEDGDI